MSIKTGVELKKIFLWAEVDIGWITCYKIEMNDPEKRYITGTAVPDE